MPSRLAGSLLGSPCPIGAVSPHQGGGAVSKWPACKRGGVDPPRPSASVALLLLPCGLSLRHGPKDPAGGRRAGPARKLGTGSPAARARCLPASTGSDAIALIDREAPDLVVTDLRLPGGVDGLAVARHARAHVPPISVFLISAHDADHAREAAREIGVRAFLAKPLANATFREAVQRVLGDKASGATDGSGR